MELVLIGIALMGTLAALYIQARAFTTLNKQTLDFLDKNMQVGGTPIDIARKQQDHQLEISKIEVDRLKELRAQRIASLGD